nr:tektin-2-like [Anolis sagrei ordinatus]
MATLSMKPGQRFTFPDWRMNRELLVSNAERQRIASHQIRQEARALRNETNNQTIWDEHDNRTRLNERIDCVNRLKEMLDKCLTNIDIEINALTQTGAIELREAPAHFKQLGRAKAPFPFVDRSGGTAKPQVVRPTALSGSSPQEEAPKGSSNVHPGTAGCG